MWRGRTAARADDAPDAIVIGAGHNGLVAANLLVDAGWTVAVVVDVQLLRAGQPRGWCGHPQRRHHAGTIENYPDLYLPVNQRILFKVESNDVDHSFWIPEFYFKMDAIPGRTNTFEVTPTKVGTYLGKCAELCGAYHSQMLFNVHVVTLPEYYAYLNDLKAKGQTGEIPVNPETTTVPVPSAKETTK